MFKKDNKHCLVIHTLLFRMAILFFFTRLVNPVMQLKYLNLSFKYPLHFFTTSVGQL